MSLQDFKKEQCKLKPIITGLKGPLVQECWDTVLRNCLIDQEN